MSKSERRERARQQLETPLALPAPAEPDVIDLSEAVVLNHESRILNNLSLIYLRFIALGLTRQSEITRHESAEEIDRQLPNKKHWAIENGDDRPAKGTVDWGNL